MPLTTEPVQQRFLANLFDALPQSVTWAVPVLDAAGLVTDFRIAYANESGGVHIGMQREVLVGKCIFSDIELQPFVKKTLWEQFLKVFVSGQRVEDTYFDAQRQKYLHVVRTRSEEGVLTIATDVTSAQQALNALREQSELTNGILDASINAVYACRAIRDASGMISDFRIVQLNKRFEEIIGLPARTVLNQSLLEVFPNARENGFFENARRVSEGGESWRSTIWYGDERMRGWFDISLTRLQDGYVGTFTEITAQREQQLAFEANAAKLEGILNATQTRILQLEPVLDGDNHLRDARIVLVNQAYAEFKRESRAALQGRLASEVFPSQHLPVILEHYDRSWQSGDTARFDLHCDEPGRIYWLEVKVARLDESLLVTINDYTRLRILQLELEQKIKELERSNRNLEEFAYAASHDLKEPIRKVRFFIDRLQDRLKPAPQSAEARDFERLHVSTERMRDLVDDLLAYAQVSLRPQHLEDVALGAILRNVQLDLELEIEQLGAQVRLGELPLVRGHQRQLQQLFQNLIGNALKYHRADAVPLIDVVASMVHGHETEAPLGPEAAGRLYHLIEVRDNGIGFEQAEAERIFQVFHRLHGNSEYRGTGVGLSIARKVAENHGGFIYAKGTAGAGACFYLGIPV